MRLLYVKLVKAFFPHAKIIVYKYYFIHQIIWDHRESTQAVPAIYTNISLEILKRMVLRRFPDGILPQAATGVRKMCQDIPTLDKRNFEFFQIWH